MDFRRSETQEAVAELAERILGDLADPERLADLDREVDLDGWRALADAGLLGIALPEDVGGGGSGPLELHELLFAAGRAASALPIYETLVLGAAPLATAGREPLRSELLARVVTGDVVLTAALVDRDPADPRRPRTLARAVDGGFTLHGTKTMVPAATIAERITVPAVTEEGSVVLAVVAAGAPDVTVRPQDALGEVTYGELSLEGCFVADGELLGQPSAGEDVLSQLLAQASVGLASLQAGVCAEAVRLAAEHTSTREQFGRPIATFQAVGHRVADARIDAEAVRLTALQAAWRLAEGLPSRDETAIAAWWAAEASHRVLHASHHVHGGIGVDRDYPLHRYFLLAKRSELALGGATRHLLDLAGSLATQPA